MIQKRYTLTHVLVRTFFYLEHFQILFDTKTSLTNTILVIIYKSIKWNY